MTIVSQPPVDFQEHTIHGYRVTSITARCHVVDLPDGPAQFRSLASVRSFLESENMATTMTEAQARPVLRNCGRCHACGAKVRLVLDGEEWCDECERYQRPRSHGWSSDDGTKCVSDTEAEFMEIERVTGKPVPIQTCCTCMAQVGSTQRSPLDMFFHDEHPRYICRECANREAAALGEMALEHAGRGRWFGVRAL